MTRTKKLYGFRLGESIINMSQTASGRFRNEKWYNKNVFPLVPANINISGTLKK